MPMAPKWIPSVRAHSLARALKTAREEAKLTVANAAAQLSWSPAKISHIEGLRNPVTPADVALMLNVYGVPDEARGALLQLAQGAKLRSWWTEYGDVFEGPYVALEDAAAEISVWSPLLVPGLLQAQDYARALMAGGPVPPNEKEDDRLEREYNNERRLKARLARQSLLSRDRDAPRLHVILDESVLRRPVGGPRVMRDQLRHLLTQGERPNVTIQVLPIAVGAHPGLDGPFTALQSAVTDQPDVAYVEGFHGAVYLESPHKVTACIVCFAFLRECAHNPEKSAAMISAAAEQ